MKQIILFPFLFLFSFFLVTAMSDGDYGYGDYGSGSYGVSSGSTAVVNESVAVSTEEIVKVNASSIDTIIEFAVNGNATGSVNIVKSPTAPTNSTSPSS